MLLTGSTNWSSVRCRRSNRLLLKGCLISESAAVVTGHISCQKYKIFILTSLLLSKKLCKKNGLVISQVDPGLAPVATKILTNK